MEGAVEDLEMAVEEEAGEEVGEPAEGEVEVTLKAVEAVEEEEDFVRPPRTTRRNRRENLGS